MRCEEGEKVAVINRYIPAIISSMVTVSAQPFLSTHTPVFLGDFGLIVLFIDEL